MKETIEDALIYIGFLVFSFLLVATLKWNINPATWTLDERGACLFTAFVTMLLFEIFRPLKIKN